MSRLTKTKQGHIHHDHQIDHKNGDHYHLPIRNESPQIHGQGNRDDYKRHVNRQGHEHHDHHEHDDRLNGHADYKWLIKT